MLLSVVVPVYNEAEVLPLTIKTLRKVLESIDCEFEIVFVNDGSRDSSESILKREGRLDGRIKMLSLARNFGHQAAVTAGLDFAAGDAVVIIDADLQDPPELIPEMIALYKQGFDVVSPQRKSRDGETLFKRTTAHMFYAMMQHAADRRLVPQVGDFRLLSKNAVSALRAMREQHRFMRGLVAWMGLREAVIAFERRSRVAGQTKYPLMKMLRFGWTALSSFSALPLRISVAIGLLFCFASFAYFVFAAVAALVFHAVVPGWTSLAMLQCLFSGVTLLCLGAVGEYVSKIYEELKQRPLYIVTAAMNIDDLKTPRARAIVLAEEQDCFREAGERG